MGISRTDHKRTFPSFPPRLSPVAARGCSVLGIFAHHLEGAVGTGGDGTASRGRQSVFGVLAAHLEGAGSRGSVLGGSVVLGVLPDHFERAPGLLGVDAGGGGGGVGGGDLHDDGHCCVGVVGWVLEGLEVGV